MILNRLMLSFSNHLNKAANISVGRDFPHLSRLALGPTQPPIHWIPALLPGGKPAGAWRWPPTPI